ncbi:MAG: hypothetical protein ABIH52_03325 [Candidatus Aenigmatarchaeota archaeon]
MNVGMAFLLIFSIIVIILVLVFGSDVMKDFTCMGSEAKTVKAMKDLESIVGDLYLQAEGSSDLFDLNLPGDAEFCFVDPDTPERNPAGNWKPDPVYVTLVEENGYTLWYTHCTGKDGYVMRRIQPTSNFCVKSTELYLENKGSFISIEEA